MRWRLTCLAASLALAGWAPLGCRTADSPSSAETHPSGPPINGLSVMTMPMAISVTSQAVADGFAMKIFASSPGKPKAQPIRDGQVDILLFDGILNALPEDTGTRRGLWTLTPSQLEGLKSSTAVGPAYVIALSWAANPPAADKITIFARYRPPQGPPVVSKPGYIFIPK